MNLKRIAAVIGARNREFYRDKAGLGWNIFMPIVMLLGFAFIFHNPDTNLYKVGVIGSSHVPAVQRFLATRHIDFVDQTNVDAAIDKVRHHRLDLFLDLSAEPTYWLNEQSSRGYLVERILLQAYAGRPAGLDRKPVSGRALRYVDWVLPGVLAMNVMFSSLWGVGWVIVRYRKNGVLRRLRATPLTAGEFLLAQIGSRLLVVLTTTALVFIGTNLILDFPMRGSYLALTAVLVAGAIALISMGLAVAARVRSEELADGLLSLISWPMIVLSGLWFSLEGTNVWAQRIAELLPLTHMVDAARQVMLDGAGLADVVSEIALLLAIASMLLTFSARAFRWQ